MRSDAPGTIVTFASLKGGVGGSTTVANLAWVLAAAGNRVLAVDADLETPSLHEFFGPFLLDRTLRDTDGLLDAAIDFAQSAVSQGSAGDRTPGSLGILRYVLSLNWTFKNGGELDFLPAGRQTPAYGHRSASFAWDDFVARPHGQYFLSEVEQSLRREYDYVLVDTHCGLTDVSRFCHSRLANATVVCFTLARANIDGSAHLAKEIIDGRGDRTSRLLPVPMRVDIAEKELVDRGRDYARSCFSGLIGLKDLSYWGAVEVPYFPYYAYSVMLAPFNDRAGDANSLLGATERLARYVTGQPIPRPFYGTNQDLEKVRAEYRL